MKNLPRTFAILIGGLVFVLLFARHSLGWTAAQMITTSDTDSYFPSAVVDSIGKNHIVWLEQQNSEGGEEVYYGEGDALNWQAPQNISNSSERSLNVELAIDENDNLIVVWVELQSFFGIDLSSYLMYAVKNGEGWSAPQKLSPETTFFVGPPALAVYNNAIHAVWAADSDFDQYGDVIYHSVWRQDSGWTTPQPLPLETGTLDIADITFDNFGRLHLVWDGNTTPNPDIHESYEIYYARLEDNGWTEPVNISQTSSYSFISSIAVDSVGRVHVIWMEEDQNLGQGIHIFDRILYQRLDGNEWLDQPQVLSTNSGVLFPQAAADNTGNVHFIWNNNISTNSGVNIFRIFYARWDGYTVSKPIRIIGVPADNAGQSRADFVESSGSFFDPAHMALVWSGGDAASAGQIFYSQQPINQISQAEVETSQTLADAPDLAGSNSNDLHAVWAQGSGPSDIQYSHLDGRWTNPVSISQPGFNSSWPAVALDPTNFPHVVWFAHDESTSDRIYYTHLSAAGWLSPTLLSDEFDAAGAPDIAIDANGDVHIVWEMTHFEGYPSFAIYYRRTIEGGSKWLDYEQISPTGHNANRPQLALDREGDPHVVWYDVDEQEIYYSTRGLGTWSMPENISNTPGSVVGLTITSQGPSIAIDSEDVPHIAWMDTIGKLQLDSVFYVKRLVDGWERHTLMSRPNTERDMDKGSGVNVQVISGPDGNVHVIWHDVNTGSAFHIYDSNNLSENGWSLPTLISQNSSNAIRPAGFLDEQGRLHFIWTDLQQTRQIFYQRQDRFDWIKVVNENGQSMPGSQLYRNSFLAGETDSRGLYFPTDLNVGDEYVALAQVNEFSGVRPMHISPDTPGRNWAYRTYLTNWSYDFVGNRIGEEISPNTGEKVLTVHTKSPLILFNLVVSLQWPATITYTQTFSDALQLASNYLFDASNGQMAIGNATIYSNGQFWRDADIQVLAFNHSRPNSDINGIRDALSPPVRVGRSWSGEVGEDEREGPWNESDGYRTLIHELGHYALGLWDSYILVERDGNGHQVDLVTAHCTDLEIRGNGTGESNATLMDYQYNASEFSMRRTEAWNDAYCTKTEQFAQHGESDWETIHRIFADATTPPRWEVQTPEDTGVLLGPDRLSLQGIPALSVVSPVTAPETAVQLIGPPDAISQAWVTLYVEQGGLNDAIDQGYSNSLGYINVLGARDGDVVRALSWDATYSGETTIQTGIVNTMTMTLVSNGNIVRSDIAPRYVRHLPHANGKGIDLQVIGLGPGAKLDGIYTLIGDNESASAPLGPNSLHNEYRGTLIPSLSGSETTLDGLSQIRVAGVDVNDSPVYLTSRSAFFSLEQGNSRQLFSSDGHLRLIVPPNAVPASISQLRVLVTEQNGFAPPENANFLSPVYELRLGGSVASLSAPSTLIIHSSEAPTSTMQSFIARFDETTKTWQALSTSVERDNQSASVSVTTQGFYALLGAKQGETPSSTPTSTPTQTETSSPTPTHTSTATPTPTPMLSSTPTFTLTPTSTPTQTETPSPTPTHTSTATPTPTPTPSNTPTFTLTPTSTPTQTETSSPTPTHTSTATPTPTPMLSSTPTFTLTPTSTPTQTETSSPTPTHTSTATPTPTPTLSSTPTFTLTPTSTPTQTATITPTAKNQVYVPLILKQ